MNAITLLDLIDYWWRLNLLILALEFINSGA